MSSINPLIRECSQGDTNFAFKSKSDTHLSVKITRPEQPVSKKKFSAVELKQMKFNQQILSNPEQFEQFFNRFAELFQGQENPLKKTHSLGFCYGIDERNPYYQAHPEWCRAVQGRPVIRGSPSYERRLEECRQKLAVTHADEGVDDHDRAHLEQIKKGVQSICCQLQKKEPDEQIIAAAIQTIHERVYQLLVMPMRKVLNYAQSNFQIYRAHCNAFRSILSKLDDPEGILEIVLEGMRSGQWHVAAEHENSRRLMDEAKRLIKEESARACGEADRYWKEENVNYCFKRCFTKQMHLLENFDNMLKGRYASLQEIPRDIFSDGKIYSCSYLPQLFALLKCCEAYETVRDPVAFFDSLKIYLINREEHFQKNVIPLLFFGQCVKNILLWPRIYPLSNGEREYVNRNLYLLMGIANSNFSGDIRISYDYLTISPATQDSAQNVLKNKNCSLENKRQACRTLLHAGIPWQALCAIGALIHTSGGVSETTAKCNQKKVSDVLVDLVDELAIVDRMIDALIAFELTEFIQEPLPVIPVLPLGCFRHILTLGGETEKNRSLVKVQHVLSQWNNVPTLAEIKFKLAMLRTLQVLGEICKNLGEYGILSGDDVWEKLEELRDLLSHSERFIIAKRLEKLLGDESVFSQLQDDFRTLAEYFRHPTKGKAYFILKGLERVYLVLTEKIPREKKDLLIITAKNSEARTKRSHIIAIHSELQAVMDTRTFLPKYVDEIVHLPLTNSQKEELRKIIQTLTSPKAAINNAKNEKTSLLKQIKGILIECKKSSKLSAAVPILDQILTMLSSENIQEVQRLLDTIDWGDYKRDKIEEIKELLPKLTASTEDYVTCKTEEFKRLLGEINIVEDPQQLIDDLELGRVTESSLAIRLTQLGVSDHKLWNDVHKSLRKMSPQEVKEIEKGDALETAKKNTLNCIDFILSRLELLDQLYPKENHQSVTFLQKNPILLLACEYLVADFRGKASLLEENLEIIRQLNPGLHQQMIQEVQQKLLQAISTGNHVLHAHDVTEPSTMTDIGWIGNLNIFILTLIVDVNLERNRNVTLPSLASQLRTLKDMLSSLDGTI